MWPSPGFRFFRQHFFRSYLRGLCCQFLLMSFGGVDKAASLGIVMKLFVPICTNWLLQTVTNPLRETVVVVGGLNHQQLKLERAAGWRGSSGTLAPRHLGTSCSPWGNAKMGSQGLPAKASGVPLVFCRLLLQNWVCSSSRGVATDASDPDIGSFLLGGPLD